ncbi:hypothetical protein JW879_06010 [candidate division WOR-3 bacterium]|nr:hypothetical protein [candidate division WOR-3 bacterium]
MLKLKQQHFTQLFIYSLILVFFINSCGVTGPRWKYKVSDPYHENTYHHEYVYRSYPLNIKLNADDFAFNTHVNLQITTSCDSIKIYPASVYIRSPYFVDNTHLPNKIEAGCFPGDSLYTPDNKLKKINKDEISGPYFLHKEDKLFVNLKFESFAKHVKRVPTAPFSEKSDFILHYDIFNNKNPLTFNFTPSADTTKEQ